MLGKAYKMTIKIHACYGVLTAEKKTVYASTPCGVCSDSMIVELPDGWFTYETVTGSTALISPWKWCYAVDEVLQSRDNEPWFFAIAKGGAPYSRKLKVVG